MAFIIWSQKCILLKIKHLSIADFCLGTEAHFSRSNIIAFAHTLYDPNPY